MNNDPRGTVFQQGNIMRIDSALVEDVSAPNMPNGFLLISYAVTGPNNTVSVSYTHLDVYKRQIIDRYTIDLLPALSRRDPSHNVGARLQHYLGLQRTGFARNRLYKNLGILINQD